MVDSPPLEHRSPPASRAADPVVRGRREAMEVMEAVGVSPPRSNPNLAAPAHSNPYLAAPAQESSQMQPPLEWSKQAPLPLSHPHHYSSSSEEGGSVLREIQGLPRQQEKKSPLKSKIVQRYFKAPGKKEE